MGADSFFVSSDVSFILAPFVIMLFTMNRLFSYSAVAFLFLAFSGCGDSSRVTPSTKTPEAVAKTLDHFESKDAKKSEAVNAWVDQGLDHLTAEEECREDEMDSENPVEAFVSKKVNAASPGHSSHGHVFDEGPRQAAKILPNHNAAHFELESCRPEVSGFFDQGIFQLHGFAFYEAERSFRQVAKMDPNCAMAYWGMSIAHFLFNAGSPARACKFSRIADFLKTNAGPRESAYIDALHERFSPSVPTRFERMNHFVEALRQIAEKYPDDLDAKAFYVVFKWNSSSLKESETEELGGLLKEVLTKNPKHPAYHYQIHLFDSQNESAGRALEAAKLNGPTSPGIAHQWHMASHIFGDLNMSVDAALATEAAAKTELFALLGEKPLSKNHSQVMPYQIHNYRHHVDYFIKSNIAAGRVLLALEAARQLRKIPNRIVDKTPIEYTSFEDESAWKSLYIIRLFQLWDHLDILDDSAVKTSTEIWTQLNRSLLIYRAVIAKTLDKKYLEEASSKLDQAFSDFKELTNARLEKASAAIKPYIQSDLKEAEDFIRELELFKSLTHSTPAEAADLLVQISNLGYMKKFELASVAMDLGLKDWAEKWAIDGIEAEMKSNDKFKMTLPAEAEAVRVLNWVGKKSLAKEAVIDAKPYLSLVDQSQFFSPLIAELSRSERKPLVKFKADKSIEWTPVLASPLVEKKIRQGSRPTLLVFYLSLTCNLCSKQINLFKTKAKEFENAQIDVKFISSASPEQVASDIDLMKDDFHFQMISDQQADLFRAFGAYDDFEEKPLHGIFLLNSKKQMLIQEVSASAQMNLDQLLKESKRMLDLYGR
ncbi:MAG: ahpC [Bacteriovoracaceae bacterium]|nr:ahpC [Bacteriovoracaceae bacterium]